MYETALNTWGIKYHQLGLVRINKKKYKRLKLSSSFMAKLGGGEGEGGDGG